MRKKLSLIRIRYISKEVCRIFAFADTNAVLVMKNDRNKNAIFLLKQPFRIRRESVAKPIIVSILPLAKSFDKMLDFSLSKILHVPFG